jgi:hypothetical protein
VRAGGGAGVGHPSRCTLHVAAQPAPPLCPGQRRRGLQDRIWMSSLTSIFQNDEVTVLPPERSIWKLMERKKRRFFKNVGFLSRLSSRRAGRSRRKETITSRSASYRRRNEKGNTTLSIFKLTSAGIPSKESLICKLESKSC